jgi:hypothetical protein
LDGPDASLVRAGQRRFLVHANYEALLHYNCAHHYALAVGILAERISEGAKSRLRCRRSICSAVSSEAGADEVMVEAKESPESKFLHDREADAVNPADAAVLVADEQLPCAGAPLDRRFHKVTKPSTLDRLTKRERLVDRAARLQQGDRLSQNRLGCHESKALVLESLRQLLRPAMY